MTVSHHLCKKDHPDRYDSDLCRFIESGDSDILPTHASRLTLSTANNSSSSNDFYMKLDLNISARKSDDYSTESLHKLCLSTFLAIFK